MPRYHAIDTAIKLSVWDPRAPKSKTQRDRDHTTSSSSIGCAFSRLNGSILHQNKRKDEEKSGPATGCVIDDLKEEYFEGHEGVDFLGPGTPFYLVKAGRELFATEEETLDAAQGLQGAPSNTIQSTALATAIDGPLGSSRLSDLSNIEAESFASGEGSFTAPERAVAEEKTYGQPGKWYRPAM